MDDVTQIDRPMAAGYDSDFYAWALEQAARIRALNVPGLDAENVAEEIESLGRSDKRELRSRLSVLLAHLLKWRYQPEFRSKSWVLTIDEQRVGIEVVLSESPSLRRVVPVIMGDAYRLAVRHAVKETELPPATFPKSCPWAPGEVFDDDWLPE